MMTQNWKITPSGYLKDGETTIADLRYARCTPEHKAVIAAAPDLLDACKRAYDFAVKMSRGPQDEADTLSGKLIMAIAKAEGR